jgi:hypothetical protein
MEATLLWIPEAVPETSPERELKRPYRAIAGPVTMLSGFAGRLSPLGEGERTWTTTINK